MGRTLVTAVLAATVLAASTAASARPPVAPFESPGDPAWDGPIDAAVRAALKKHRIEPANLCSDAVFVRRVYLDVLGTLPEAGEAHAFLTDQRSDKRSRLIDDLLAREEFADYQTLKWCDLLRVKSEFPINLWPNAVQAYHRWIREAIRADMPYDQFVRELLTASGSNFRVPQVNFYRAIQGREPPAIADAVALTFMGVRTEHWTADERARLAAFFSRLAYKQTSEWKEEIVQLDPAPAGPLEVVFPDGTKATVRTDQDPRQVFADWLIAPKNPWFTRNIVNRVWARLMGRGIIHEPDDIRPANPPANPRLLAALEGEFAKARFDMKRLYRLILNSRVYQQSAIPEADDPDAEAMSACYVVRPLEAEVLIDALNMLFGGGEGYTSPIPEPFTYIPDRQRTIALADGSITSSFLEMFGRPPRDTGLESERNTRPTDAQRLHLLNSTHIQKKIEGSQRLRQLVNSSRRTPGVLVRQVYLSILSRYPTPDELATFEAYLKMNRSRLDQCVNDLVWALINSKEFLYRH